MIQLEKIDKTYNNIFWIIHNSENLHKVEYVANTYTANPHGNFGKLKDSYILFNYTFSIENINFNNVNWDDLDKTPYSYKNHHTQLKLYENKFAVYLYNMNENIYQMSKLSVIEFNTLLSTVEDLTETTIETFTQGNFTYLSDK